MRFLTACLAVGLLLSPGLADARPGLGGSMGSRGSRTYMTAPGTASAPYGSGAFSQSMTPNSYGGYQPGYGNYGSGYGYRRPLGSGLLGGLFGAGLLGMMLGGGFFGFHGGAGLLGLLIQFFLIFLLFRWVRDRFLGGPVLAGGPAGPGGFFRTMFPPLRPASGAGGFAPPRARGVPVALTSNDYQQFSRLLTGIQAAWSAPDLNGLRAMCTPEMLGYFNTQLSELASRGEHNIVRDVVLQQGDLSEAWAEGGTQYATVSLRYTMIDVTTDRAGRVVDGSPTERVTVTEFWTFVRANGGHWILSAIQQPR